jgi:hypothetical protein
MPSQVESENQGILKSKCNMYLTNYGQKKVLK